MIGKLTNSHEYDELDSKLASVLDSRSHLPGVPVSVASLSFSFHASYVYGSHLKDGAR